MAILASMIPMALAYPADDDDDDDDEFEFVVVVVVVVIDVIDTARIMALTMAGHGGYPYAVGSPS
jgi:hypothetical protein